MFGVVGTLLNKCNEDEKKISPELRRILEQIKIIDNG